MQSKRWISKATAAVRILWIGLSLINYFGSTTDVVVVVLGFPVDSFSSTLKPRTSMTTTTRQAPFVLLLRPKTY
jgi:hypothetical protein